MIQAKISVVGINESEKANKLLWLFEDARKDQIRVIRAHGQNHEQYWKTLGEHLA